MQAFFKRCPLSKARLLSISAAILALFLCALQPVLGQHRPPAVPLIVHNPYFSIWSMSDRLTDEPTRHWTGTEQPLTGIVRVDGVPYRYMGATPRELPAMPQTALKITPTRTIYEFETAKVHLDVIFFTPAFPQDLDILSRPVTYVTLKTRSVDNKEHKVDLLFDADPRICVDKENQPVTWSQSQAEGLTVLNVGSRDQKVLGRSGDDLRIDWGYLHVAVPASERAFAATSPYAIDRFVKTGIVPSSTVAGPPQGASEGAAHLAVGFHADCLPAHPQERHLLVAYTEGFAIEYLGERLKPYWQRNGMAVEQMLAQADHDYVRLERRGEQHDEELTADLTHVGGPGYAELAVLAYRQTLAAHVLVAGRDGAPMLFAKENSSNGDVGTVDVLYPSAPFFLLLNPQLLEAQMRPVLNYASLPRWKFPFAPHDLGQYPLANGQLYGGGERTEEDQMPIEESANLLILGAALGQAQGDWRVASQYWPEFTKWAEYIRAKGLDPENQLCTDDFAGHLAHNANLSIKAIEGLGAYALMAKGLGKPDTARDYTVAAKAMAEKWTVMDEDADHFRLAFNIDGSWSQKYNLVWDRLLGIELFDPRVKDTELQFYKKQMKPYGLPLDSRAQYTKLDWEVWSATLAPDKSKFEAFLEPIVRWIGAGPSRVPLTDWYDTNTGKEVGFKARSVVGGVYIRALTDSEVTQKWRSRAQIVRESK